MEENSEKISDSSDFEIDFDEFDPLEVDDDEINQEDMDDDNPYDTIDYPTVRNSPDELLAMDSVFTPEKQGSAKAAMIALIDHNHGRRPVLLEIINLCRTGAKTSALREAIAKKQEFNKSVFSAMSFCRMLERAGGLTVEVPEVAQEREVIEDGVAYLEIVEAVDPIWTATPDALEVYDHFIGGDPFRDVVFNRDSKYYDVYLDVLQFIADSPRSLVEVDNLVEGYPICQHPKRYGGHFIDWLEQTDAIEWLDNAWTITALGRDMLDKMVAAKAEGIQIAYEKEAE